ncbi:MAG: hypothetical protein K2K45_01105 [Muribaculaceae bacterium]|nr:hypothetical protein [Muribaculaceae bacterium]
MKLSISNKNLKQKPTTQKEKSVYFKDLKFKTEDLSIEAIKEIIDTGYTITYLYSDNEFDRRNHYMTKNYLGTQFICVDIDKCEIPPAEFIKHVQYKPSVMHTTFSNLTERKDYKYCFHLLYFFNEVIYGEDNFHYVFNLLTEDYNDFIDRQAMDCHRIMFTSNSSLNNYEYYDYGIIYRVNDFIRAGDNDWDKISAADIYNNSKNNISEKTDLSRQVYCSTSSFTLDKEFYQNMFTMNRSEFIYHYSSTYPYITETYVDPGRYENGYVDLRHEDYYVVPTAQYRWDSERQKPYIPKIKEGSRTKMLWYDALCFMKIVPEITKEYLVYLLTAEVYRNFDNEDKQMDNMFIINKCREVWNSIDTITVKPMKRSFRIDKNYWIERGMDNWLSITNHIRKQIRSNDFENLYDCSLTIEQNITEFKKFGVITTPKTLKTWLENNGIPYITDKEMRDRTVIKLYEEDKSRSSRELERLCKEHDVEVNYRTIQRILNKHNRDNE